MTQRGKRIEPEKNVQQLYVDHLKLTLLGRLRLKLFEEITGKRDTVPPKSVSKQYVLQLHRLQPEFSKILIHIGGVNQTCQIPFNKLPQITDLSDLLKSLEFHPWAKPKFLELQNCPRPLPKEIGVLIYCETLEHGGEVYVINILDEK